MKGFFRKKLPACLLALAMLAGMVPAASAASADLTYDVDEDSYVWLDADDFWDLYDDLTGGDLEYVEFTDYDSFDDYGWFEASGYEYDDYVSGYELYESDLDDARFYYDEDDVWDDYEFELDTLEFVTYDNIDDDTLDLDVRLYGTDGSEYATVRIEVYGGSGSSGDVKLTYAVDPDDEVSLDADDFWDLFDEESREDFEYLEFYSYDDFDDYGYFEAEDEYGDWAELTDSTLDDGRYYYDWYDTSTSYDYGLDNMTFVADWNADEDTLEFPFTMYGHDDDEVDGVLYIEIGSGTGTSQGDITYQVDPDDEVTVDAEDFYDLFWDESDDDELEYIEFTSYDDFDDYGWFEADGYDYDDYVRGLELNESDLDDAAFYYDEDDVWDDYEFELDTLTFCADRNADEDELTFDFTMHGVDGDRVYGTLCIEIGQGTGTQVDGDILYEVDPDDSVTFDRDDFWDFLDDETGDDLEYVTFTDAENLDDWGELYSYNYDDDRIYFDEGNLDDGWFYYNAGDLDSSSYDDDCTLDDLTFVADSDADGKVVYLDFTAHGEDGDRANGTVAIAIGDVDGVTAQGGDIRYNTTYSGRVQISANDIAQFFEESYPGYTVQYMVLEGLPAYGSLYYNYYGTSDYGTSSSMRMTEALCEEIDFYFNPSSSQYAMTELTYVPSGVNYCAQIPFTAYGTGSRSVSGTILISVNLDEVPDIYGPTPVNTSVTFPAASIYTAVSQASGLGLAGIQLLELPEASVGTIYVGSGTATRANTSTVYGYSSGSQRISQLRFVPASGFTGSVEIPYVACNSSGVPFASGKLCLGVVREMEDYSDIDSSTWCYKYVLELSDAGVISGYSDGTFRPSDTVTYGAALKLIMLAAGYDEQEPVGSNVFSGYLARAQKDGLVSGSVDLTEPITRLAVAQIAAKAMGLSITNLSSVQPFTDTTDPYVRALNAAGIVGGYFENGTSTYKPYNTLTRGAMSAIVWRMEQYG